jgi:hypothetical protein
MTQSKRIDQDRWAGFLSRFSFGYRGRMVAIEVSDMEIGDKMLTDAAPLFAIDYDPANKGDALTISTGLDDVDYTHKISAPVEIFEFQNEYGKMLALEVISRDGARTTLVFKS